MKLEMYYVVEITEGRTAHNQIVKDARYISGPFGDHRDAINSKREEEYKILSSVWLEIATQYVEVEI